MPIMKDTHHLQQFLVINNSILLHEIEEPI